MCKSCRDHKYILINLDIRRKGQRLSYRHCRYLAGLM